ncbi:unnamed protein product [Ranitomeya imitator]|uniref:Helix-turn-helix domain-containing protein n=1 Tax=Ranitomeya imitator TaxID=111125 RepID=A0ABN9LPD8_9NEOB|nr:unnamed protein product [Ranitomeya imitator]
MGTPVACVFANLFLAAFEEKHITGALNPYLKHIRLYLRFADDVFIVWDGGEPTFNDFVSFLNNNNDQNMKFTSIFGDKQLEFLDVKIEIEEGSIKTSVHRKTTATNNVLHFQSAHPAHTKCGIPYSQMTKDTIKELESKLANQDVGLVTSFKNKLKDTLDKYEIEITQRKGKKFQRDKADFEQGLVYKWKHMGNARRPKNYRSDPLPSAPTSLYREESSSDFLSSAGSEVDHGPDAAANTSHATKRFVRHRGHTSPHRHKKLTFQVMYRRPDILQTISTDDRQTFQDLLELLEENEADPNRRKFPHRNKSLKAPSFSLIPAIKIFFEMVKRDIMAMPIRVSGPSNLSIEEKRALMALQNNRDFIIKEADKGGNVVLWSTQHYEAEAKRQLNNLQYYQKLPSDPTSIFLSKFEQLLHRALQLAIISPQEKQYLWVANPVTATFYMLPKIHKDSLNPPGRPIVSSVGSMCERAGEYLDFFLQPIASSLPSFVRDSSHFIDICSQVILPTDFLLITCDVESLYSNIDHKDGIGALAYFLDKKTSMDRAHDSFLLDLMSFVLHHNFFLFDRVHYLQRSGVAMGARCAPAYANIFLGWWEDKIVYSSPLFTAHVHAWYRFIDDVFIIWRGTKEECAVFFDNLNSNLHNIFLTYSCSARDVTFLDLRVFPHEQHLATDLFRKPTATNSLLEFSSFHPWHTKVGVPTGQFLRVRRNCTRDGDFLIQARELSERFRHRGYPKRVISTAYQRARGQDQKSLLSSKRQGQEMQTRFITDFNDNWRQVSDILSRHWQILRVDAQTSEVTSNRPLLTARRAPNLRDLLTRSHFKRPTVKLNRATISLRKSLCVTATNDQAPAGRSLVAEESPELYFVAGSPVDIAGSACVTPIQRCLHWSTRVNIGLNIGLLSAALRLVTRCLPWLPGDFGIVGRWRAVCVTALQRPNSDAAAIRIVVGIAAASLSVKGP